MVPAVGADRRPGERLCLHRRQRRPTLEEIQHYLGGAPFANWTDQARRFATSETLEPKSHKFYLRTLLYPGRFCYSWMTGRMGSNDDAVAFLGKTCPTRPQPDRLAVNVGRPTPIPTSYLRSERRCRLRSMPVPHFLLGRLPRIEPPPSKGCAIGNYTRPRCDAQWVSAAGPLSPVQRSFVCSRQLRTWRGSTRPGRGNGPEPASRAAKKIGRLAPPPSKMRHAATNPVRARSTATPVSPPVELGTVHQGRSFFT